MKSMKRLCAAFLCMVMISALMLCGSTGAQENVLSDGDIKTGVIGAMDEEVASLKEAMTDISVQTIAGMEFCEGTLDGEDVVVVQSRMGKVNAGICAQILICEFGVDRVINTGVAGSLDPDIDIGDIVVSTDAVQHDFDLTPLGYAPGETDVDGLTAFPADEELIRSAVAAVKETSPEIHVYEGRICTGDQFIASREQKETIISTFGGLCCEMEGGAIAQACYLNQIPFVIIRAISDKADDSEEVSYEQFMEEAARHCAAVTRYMISHDKAVTVPVKKIKKHGNVVLDISFEKMRSHNMEIGDVITVYAGEKAYDMPIGSSYSDVDSGDMICRFDKEDNEVTLAINMGSFAETAGIGEERTIEEDPGYEWDIQISEVRLSLKEKEGYLDEYQVRNLVRSDLREDYPDLTDEDFANFREVCAAGMKEQVLYRSSTPLDPALGRNEYAMAATERAGIRSVINLTDSVQAMKDYSTYSGSYYSQCQVANPELNYDFGSDAFAGKVKDSISFILENDGPYLIHCKEGKDRTGILCAILECFAGVSAQEVEQDYMLTYRNFYNITPENDAYTIILDTNLVKVLCRLFQIDQIDTADLQEEAREYLLFTGLTEEQLDNLREILVYSRTK